MHARKEYTSTIIFVINSFKRWQNVGSHSRYFWNRCAWASINIDVYVAESIRTDWLKLFLALRYEMKLPHASGNIKWKRWRSSIGWYRDRNSLASNTRKNHRRRVTRRINGRSGVTYLARSSSTLTSVTQIARNWKLFHERWRFTADSSTIFHRSNEPPFGVCTVNCFARYIDFIKAEFNR